MRFLNRSLYKKRFLTSMVCVLLSWTTSASVAGSPAGMAMDIQGQAQQSTAGNKSPVKLLDYIQPGTSLELAEKSSLSLTLYNEKKLYRLKYRNLHQTGNDQPESSVMLDEVEAFEIVVLNPNELSSWPESSVDSQQTEQLRMLPKGIKINLTVRDVQYEWIFSLLQTDFLKKKDN